jgi:hypothetical protein
MGDLSGFNPIFASKKGQRFSIIDAPLKVEQVRQVPIYRKVRHQPGHSPQIVDNGGYICKCKTARPLLAGFNRESGRLELG